jgi:hypothetical protein
LKRSENASSGKRMGRHQAICFPDTPTRGSSGKRQRTQKSSSPFCGFKPYTPVCVCVCVCRYIFWLQVCSKMPRSILVFFSYLPFQSASQITETHTHTHTHTLADATTHARRETVSHSCSGAIFLTKKPVALSEPAGRGLCILLCDDILEGNDDQFILSPTHFFFSFITTSQQTLGRAIWNQWISNTRYSFLYQTQLPPTSSSYREKKNARKDGKSRFSPHITNYQCTKLFFRYADYLAHFTHTHTLLLVVTETHLSEIQSRKK